MRKKLSLFIVVALFLGSYSPALAEELSNGTAVGIVVNETNVQNGEIISSTKQGYKRSVSPYDPQIFGVVSKKPAVYLSDASTNDQTPIVSIGEAEVRVTTSNGAIKRGDYITSSTIPGVGAKALDNGYVLGTAQEDYNNRDPKKIGLILVTLHPHFVQISNSLTRNVFNAASLGLTAAMQTPTGVLRYIIAGVITLLSFFFGFRFFARASNRGVEAIGRNPLAKQAILMSVFINSAITIAIMLFGVAISYLILVL